MKATERGVLTPWRRQREGQVTIRKEIGRAKATHILEMAEKGTSQDTERYDQARGTHSLEMAEVGKRQDTKRKAIK